jgi:hypothetical protein
VPVRHGMEAVADGDGEAREGLLVSVLCPSDEVGVHVTSDVSASGSSERSHGMGHVEGARVQSPFDFVGLRLQLSNPALCRSSRATATNSRSRWRWAQRSANQLGSNHLPSAYEFEQRALSRRARGAPHLRRRELKRQFGDTRPPGSRLRRAGRSPTPRRGRSPIPGAAPRRSAGRR